MTVIVIKLMWQIVDTAVGAFNHPPRTELMLPALAWWLVWIALFLGVPALVVLGPFRRVPWLIWLVLGEALVNAWALLAWGQFLMHKPKFLFDFATSVVLVYLAYAWVRVSKY